MRTIEDRIRTGKRAILTARRRGVDTAEWEAHLRQLWDTAMRAAETQKEFERWSRWEWYRASIPHWRSVLARAITNGEEGREQYARRMLDETFLDPGPPITND
jgi:hypothetical protein